MAVLDQLAVAALPAKLLVEAALLAVSYSVQQRFLFTPEHPAPGAVAGPAAGRAAAAAAGPAANDDGMNAAGGSSGTAQAGGQAGVPSTAHSSKARSPPESTRRRGAPAAGTSQPRKPQPSGRRGTRRTLAVQPDRRPAADPLQPGQARVDPPDAHCRYCHSIRRTG